MSHLQYSAYKGVGERNLKQYKYNEAVRIGDRVECAGQGGWDPETGAYNTEISAQIEQAFKNVDLNLKDAGGKGWEQVFRVNSYHVPLNDEALRLMVEGFEKWMPNHKPIWTTVGVQRLGEDDMRVEIEVVAHDPKE
ncbi:endoribonuclease L-PSP [Lophiotrema nucula]|uniref:Endoribonuclease L-PSP n=1 Tax=Lophiotrema nucula TaxID=690887 RepID=A0A6A5YYG6_9PLEO|nr:endoribonuclease L-PSP [Lophiotrema nucula]